MKIKLLRTSALLLALASALAAAPLTQTTAVHTKPDASAPTITVLNAGTEPTAAPDSLATTPAGWMAVVLPGPFEAYVENKDFAKSLDVKPGSAIRLAPKADAGVLKVATATDKTTITGLHGKWTQISLEGPLTGYINIGGTPGYLPPIATTPAAAAPVKNSSGNNPSAPPPVSPAPVTPNAYGVGAAGQPAPIVTVADPNALPRQFAGKFVSTHSPFRPRRPYDYALNDEAGKRYAYLDISKLLQTDQIEKYIDHNVVVFGAAKATADGKDIVIQVETLRLR